MGKVLHYQNMGVKKEVLEIQKQAEKFPKINNTGNLPELNNSKNIYNDSLGNQINPPIQKNIKLNPINKNQNFKTMAFKRPLIKKDPSQGFSQTMKASLPIQNFDVSIFSLAIFSINRPFTEDNILTKQIDPTAEEKKQNQQFDENKKKDLNQRQHIKQNVRKSAELKRIKEKQDDEKFIKLILQNEDEQSQNKIPSEQKLALQEKEQQEDEDEEEEEEEDEEDKEEEQQGKNDKVSYVNKFRNKINDDVQENQYQPNFFTVLEEDFQFAQSIQKFESPAIFFAKKQPQELQENEEVDESIQQESYMTKSENKSSNRLGSMKQASSHDSSSNSNDKDKLKVNYIINNSRGDKNQAYILSTDNLQEQDKIQQLKQEKKQEKNESNQVFGEIIKWRLGDFIGAGNFGQVYRAMNVDSGHIFAVRKLGIGSQFDQQYLKNLDKELKIIQKLDNKYIVKYYGHEVIDQHLYMYLEYMDSGNISQILQKYGQLELNNIKLYTRQILEGLKYLHSQNVVHKDIKGANILVSNDGTVKLSDFGCAKQLELTLNSLSNNSNKDSVNAALKGSVPWMAPEVITQTNYSYKADIWSLGCTLLEITTGKIPWMQYDFDNPIQAIMKIGLSQEIPLIPDGIDANLNDCIIQCLNRDASLRPTAEELLKHVFYL